MYGIILYVLFDGGVSRIFEVDCHHSFKKRFGLNFNIPEYIQLKKYLWYFICFKIVDLFWIYLKTTTFKKQIVKGAWSVINKCIYCVWLFKLSSSHYSSVLFLFFRCFLRKFYNNKFIKKHFWMPWPSFFFNWFPK